MKAAHCFARWTLWLLTMLWASTAAAELTTGNLVLIDSVRVSRTQFEYTYALEIINAGSAVENVAVTVTSSAASTVVIDSVVNVDYVAANSTVTSSETFSVRQDRTVAFDPSVLSFAITATPVFDVASPLGNLRFAQISNTRVGRSLFEYSYEVRLTNTFGADLGDVVVNIASASVSTTVMVPQLSFGAVVSGSAVTSPDTFTLQQDRLVAFNPDDLVVTVAAMYAFDVDLPPIGTLHFAQVSNARVDRSLFEYSYQVSLTNTSGSDQSDAIIDVTSNAASTVVMTTPLNFGPITAGATGVSPDIFTLQQDRLVAFNPSDLSFALRLPPDLDGDGIPDAIDADRDGDGISNDYEIQVGTNPDDATSVPPDLDGDGSPDSLDDDLDGDGVPNAQDLFPTNPAESSDLDGDSIGDNSDPDRDGDGFTNEEEILAGSNPDDASSVPAGTGLGITFSAGNPASTTEQFVDLEGGLSGTTFDRVYLTSDQFGGTTFAASITGNSWTSRVALKVGANVVTAHLEGNSGGTAEAVKTIQRTEPPPVITLDFNSPANNSLLTTPDVVVTGRVTSDTVVPLPQISVNGTSALVSQGATPTEFTFSTSLVLQPGSNTIIASTLIAGQVLQSTLTLNYQSQTTEIAPPAISIVSPQPGKTLTADSFVLSALVLSDAGIASLTVNGQAVTLSASNQIETSLSFAGQPTLNVTIVATDNLNQVSTLNASYYLDIDAPVIQVDNLAPYPTDNVVDANPYQLTGTVTDVNLTQITLNGQVLSLEPTATQYQYRFSASLAVPAGSNSLNLAASDAAGNVTTVEYLVTASSNIQIEWLAPANNAEILLENPGQTLNVSARLSDTTGVGSVLVEIQDQALTPVILALDTDIASGQITLPETDGDYTLRMSVLDTNSAVLITSTRNIKLQSAQVLPLSVVKMTPADEATDVEPNDFVAVFFNKPISLDLLTIELHETAHGFSYVDVDAPGLDGLHAQGYVLQDINRDYEPVPGVFSLLPNNTTAVYYAQRDMAYGADMYITVSYDGTEMARRHFKVRPRPTFVEGVVLDNLAQPVSGVEVAIPELNRFTKTNKDGAYSFGYGDPADQTMPGGNYTIVANQGLKDRRFGTSSGYVNIQAGTVNKVDNISLTLLNQAVPFSYLNSGLLNVINGNELSFDATNASFVFGNGRNEGAVHVQFLPYSSLQQSVFKVDYTPIWAYGVQPAGTQVQGDLQVEFALPKFQGSYDYAPTEGEQVILLGKDEANTSLVPVGVGEVLAGHRIHSLGETHFNTLDYIAYARVTPDLWADLHAYASGDLDLQSLTLRLQTFTFIPPASDAEALERGNAILGQ